MTRAGIADPMASASSSRIPHLTIRPKSGWAALNILEVWHFRDLLWSLAGRDIKLRYRQTALGVVWVVLQPIITAAIFAFFFGVIAKLDDHGVPRFILAYAGLLGWNTFASTVGKASTCLVGSAQLISKVYFPRLILPLSTLVSTLIDFVVAFAMMVVFLFWKHIPVHAALLLLPIWLLFIACLALGFGLYTAALMVSYRDVGYIVPVLIQFLFFASPVAYAVADVPDRYRTLFNLNPISGLLEAFRWSLLGMPAPSPGLLIYSAGFSLAAFIVGAFAFRKMERRFADVI